MCQFKSGLILKNKTICPLDSDSHEDMIRQAGLKDDTCSPDFVRVEIVPIDGDIFNIHVKSILHHNVKDYGISFLMEKKDKLFKDNLKMGEVFAFNIVKDKNTVYFKGFLNAAMVVLGKPKKTSLESKYAIYFEDQNKDAVLFHLSI